MNSALDCSSAVLDFWKGILHYMKLNCKHKFVYVYDFFLDNLI